jgi:tetratricopeptide (TPR) repeat protein
VCFPFIYICINDDKQVSLVKVGITLLLLKQFDEALWSFREALQVRKHALGALHPSTARIYNNVGCVYVEFNEFKQARRSFEAALDIQRSALAHPDEHHPDTNKNMGADKYAMATTLCNLGYLYRYRDMYVWDPCRKKLDRRSGRKHSWLANDLVVFGGLRRRGLTLALYSLLFSTPTN